MTSDPLLPLTILSLVMTASAFAGKGAGKADTSHLDKREAHQEKRIQHGIQSGALTSQEASALVSAENKLKADEAAAKADGKVTKQERAVLKAEANSVSSGIHQLKHNQVKPKKK
jgi:hypothetical protein